MIRESHEEVFLVLDQTDDEMNAINASSEIQYFLQHHVIDL